MYVSTCVVKNVFVEQAVEDTARHHRDRCLRFCNATSWGHTSLVSSEVCDLGGKQCEVEIHSTQWIYLP